MTPSNTIHTVAAGKIGGRRLLYRVWLGYVDYDAVRCGGIVVEGPRELARALPRWLMWSRMADFIHTHRESSRPRTVKFASRPQRAG